MFSDMAPRIGSSEPPVPVEAGMNGPPDELGLSPVITEETYEQKRPPMQIVWRNVILMALLHLAALYALTLIPSAKILTLIWSKFYPYRMKNEMSRDKRYPTMLYVRSAKA